MLQLARSEERSSEALLSLDSGNGLTWQSVTKQEENCVACDTSSDYRGSVTNSGAYSHSAGA